MKKAILIALAALLLVSSFTACGSKKANYDEDGYSRVLYDDSDTERLEEDEGESSKEYEQSENSEESQTDTDSAEGNEGKIESRSENSDSDKKNTTTVTAKKAASSSASSKDASSSSGKSTTVKSTTSKASVTTSSKAASVAASSSAVSSENDDTDSSYNSDTDTNTDTEWFDSENDSTDSETEDTDSKIEKGSFEYFDMAFPVNGSSIQVGQDFKTADDLLGGPNNKVGNVYYYNECEITTNGNEDNEIITNITINNYGYYISKGIGIGSTTEDLLRAFGDAEFGYTYTLGDRILNFTVLEDTVTGISFS